MTERHALKRVAGGAPAGSEAKGTAAAPYAARRHGKGGFAGAATPAKVKAATLKPQPLHHRTDKA